MGFLTGGFAMKKLLMTMAIAAGTFGGVQAMTATEASAFGYCGWWGYRAGCGCGCCTRAYRACGCRAYRVVKYRVARRCCW
jgi:hypothetical protein